VYPRPVGDLAKPSVQQYVSLATGQVTAAPVAPQTPQ